MKNILIFYGSFGAGHFSAARSIKEYVDKNYKNTNTKIVDCIEYISHTLNKITTTGYDHMSKKAPIMWGKIYNSSDKRGTISRISNTSNKIMSIKLNKIIQDFKPDLIISTHPFSSQMCSILKKKGKINCKIASVLTDYAPHSQWLINAEYVDYFFVAHNGMKKALHNLGIENNKIHATGIPLSTKFLQHYSKDKILKSFKLEKGKKNILFFAGGSSKVAPKNLDIILSSFIEKYKDLQVIVIAGKSLKLKKHFDEMVRFTKSNKRIKVLDFTDKVPELMSISDLAITKPGGLTTTECLASGLPLLVIDPIPGQEVQNATFLEEKNVAIWLKDENNIIVTLDSLFNDSCALQNMKIKARLLAKKNSTEEICKTLLSYK